MRPPLDERIRQELTQSAKEETRTKYQGGRTCGSPEIPSRSPPVKGRNMELPLLWRVPPACGTASHVPATVTSAAAAAQRLTKATPPAVRSFVPSGKTYPCTGIRTTLACAPTPRPSSESTSRSAAMRRTSQRQPSPKYHESASRCPPSRHQSPARGTSRHGRSASPRGRHQASRSRSPEGRGRCGERRETSVATATSRQRNPRPLDIRPTSLLDVSARFRWNIFALAH